MELPEHFTKQRPGEHEAVSWIQCRKHAERRRCNEQPQNHHSTEPYDERRQRHKTDRKHCVIIIAIIAAWIRPPSTGSPIGS